MKVSVACEGNTVSEHFGHCENFRIYEVEDKKIVESYDIPNPGHKPGFLPRFLSEKDVKIVITGGVGQKAVDIFNSEGIEVLSGASGLADDAMALFLDDKLESRGVVCNHDH